MKLHSRLALPLAALAAAATALANPVAKAARDDGKAPTTTTAAAAATTSCVKHLWHLPGFTYGPTRTVWTTTTTVAHEVDCDGCQALQVQTLNLGPGPFVAFTTTVTATTASTTVVPVCGGGGGGGSSTGADTAVLRRATAAAATSPHFYQAPPAVVYTATPAGVAADSPGCAAQTAVEAVVPDQTFTVYGATTTETRTVDCGGCVMEWSTPVLNFFAPILYTATETAQTPSTRVVVACATPTGAYQA